MLSRRASFFRLKKGFRYFFPKIRERIVHFFLKIRERIGTFPNRKATAMAIPFKENIEMNATPDPTNNKHVITYGALKDACNNASAGGISIDSTTAKVYAQPRYLFPKEGADKEYAPAIISARRITVYGTETTNSEYVYDDIYIPSESIITTKVYSERKGKQILNNRTNPNYDSTYRIHKDDVVLFKGHLFKCKNETPNPPLQTDGDGLAIDADYEYITVFGEISGLDTRITALENGGGSSYTLPTASEQTKGGIKVGSGLTIDANDILSVSIFSASTSVSSSHNTATVQLSSGTSIYKTTVNANTSFEFTAPTGYSGGTLTFELVITASADATLTWPTDNGVDMVKWLGTPDSSTGISTGSDDGLTEVKSGYTYYLVFRTNDGNHFMGNIQGVIATADAQ